MIRNGGTTYLLSNTKIKSVNVTIHTFKASIASLILRIIACSNKLPSGIVIRNTLKKCQALQALPGYGKSTLIA